MVTHFLCVCFLLTATVLDLLKVEGASEVKVRLVDVCGWCEYEGGVVVFVCM